jgi:hypothetical protein
VVAQLVMVQVVVQVAVVLLILAVVVLHLAVKVLRVVTVAHQIMAVAVAVLLLLVAMVQHQMWVQMVVLGEQLLLRVHLLHIQVAVVAVDFRQVVVVIVVAVTVAHKIQMVQMQ